MNVNQFLAFVVTALSLALLIVNYQDPATAAAWAVAMTGWMTVYLSELSKHRG